MLYTNNIQTADNSTIGALIEPTIIIAMDGIPANNTDNLLLKPSFEIERQN